LAPGHGGAAKGDGWGGQANGKPDPAMRGVRTGENNAAKAREALIEAAPLAVHTVLTIASNPDDQRALAAALSILNRIGIHEKSGVEIGSDPASPLRIEVNIRDEGDQS
jgi:hypothetical protein